MFTGSDDFIHFHTRGLEKRLTMKLGLNHLYFDKRDHELIRTVNSLYGGKDTLEYTKKRFYPFFHPLGIKELAESKGLRIASSAVHLLESLERGNESYRLQGLRGLRDEILNTAGGPMPKNTARVLLQIMKEIVRARDDYSRQLRLAHDFRKTTSGKPVLIRKQLKKYHLLEMPEEWNQVTFDDHVHDANTKGRKSPTHLIMDAWIKGIRRLRVIYYHYIDSRSAVELIEAAAIMDMDLRIGIEFSALFRGRYISLIWVSRGLEEIQAFLCFLTEPDVVEFMAQGKAIVDYHKAYVMKILESFNINHKPGICDTLGIEFPPLDPADFIRFTAPGQASILHLAIYIHARLLEPMRNRAVQLKEEAEQAGPEQKQIIAGLLTAMEELNTREIIEKYLCPEKNAHIPDPLKPGSDPAAPPRLALDFMELLSRIMTLHHSFRLTLNLSNLKVEDVLELLYDSNGMITRLEILNLKDYVLGNTNHINAISELQQAINQGSFLKLKRCVRLIIRHMEAKDYADTESRRTKLMAILHDLESFRLMYKHKTIESRIGSDSTGHPFFGYGMGLGIIETLPASAMKRLRQSSGDRMLLPITINVNYNITSALVRSSSHVMTLVLNLIRKLPGLRRAGSRKIRSWAVQDSEIHMDVPGNIITLGGLRAESGNDLLSGKKETVKHSRNRSWANLNSGVKNALKVLIGFIPASLTFMLTKEWWFLAYCGAFIWFGITGFRNILQSVLGGGGIRRSPLLRWNDYVSWERMTDSLLYTGFSVPLLDYFVKTLLLDQGMGINISTSPGETYAVMALANGIYLSTHNAIRGLPRAAVLGNFFRSILSIPIAILLSACTGGILTGLGVAGVDGVLQKWAAIISKASSDMVAGIIEGTADRFQNINLRERDYRNKLKELFDTYSQLELLFPDATELEILKVPEDLLQNHNTEARDMLTIIIINTLDMLYFWMYQPRSRVAILEMIEKMTPEERTIFFQAQAILRQEQAISRLFVDGLLGRKFSGPLSFYLTRYEEYLDDLTKMTGKRL